MLLLLLIRSFQKGWKDFMKKKEEKKKGFLPRLMEKLDKILEEKAKNAGHCCKPGNNGKGSCCS